MLIFMPQEHFPQCHASTLAQLEDGRIFAAWFAGTKEAHPDTAIWMSFIEPNKKLWSKPFVIAKIEDTAHWNPVLFVANDKMYLFFKVGKIIDTWVTYYMVFQNEKWSEPKKLVKSFTTQCNRGPVRSKPIILSNGNWIAPSSVEETVNFNAPLSANDVVWKAFVDISKNEGKTWKKSKLIDFDRRKYGLKNGKYGGIIQPTLWESKDKQVHMLLRSTAGYIFRSDSTDFGETWCEAYQTELPNNNSGIDITQWNDILVLVLNPVSGNWAARTPLSVMVSQDDFKTYKTIDIATGPGSFSYPSIIPMKNGVGITYTCNRVSIAFAMINFVKKNVENQNE